MKHKPLPSQDELKNRFIYDETIGRLVYKIPPSPNLRHKKGKPAGSKHQEGGYQVCYKRNVYLHCRLVWVYVYGIDPAELEIDHINGNRADDRIQNLRLATRAEQQWNVGKTQRNTSGYKGVSFYKRLNKWRADIRVEGKQKNLGYFATAKEANTAYQEAAKKLHKQFKNDN